MRHSFADSLAEKCEKSIYGHSRVNCSSFRSEERGLQDKSMRSRFFRLVIVVLFACLGFALGGYLAAPTARRVDTATAIAALAAYKEFRKSGDHDALQRQVAEMGISKHEFEYIIDRFIHYRTSRSALKQSMELLHAFRRGYQIVPSGVDSPDTNATDAFRRDAEVLAVFQDYPDLVTAAFET